ncbi:iron chelate uptake ABC transporter family permease subunit [Gordonia paraffinivorans]|nr:iron chelate uptake ABC transporter family permease subunit [Gordonia paraffinivorans]
MRTPGSPRVPRPCRSAEPRDRTTSARRGRAVLVSRHRVLDALLLGEPTATSMGVDVRREQLVLLLAGALVTGAAVAVTGVIAFVGLVVPHAVRLVLGTRHRILLPASMLSGAIFLILNRTGDLLGRVTRDIDRLEVFFAHTVVPAIAAVVMPSGVLLWLIVIGYPGVALAVGVSVVVLGAGVPFVGRRRVGRNEAAIVAHLGTVSAHLADSIAGLREISAFGAAPERMRTLDRVERDLAVRRRVVARWSAARVALTRACQVGALAAVVVTAHAGGADAATIAAMVAVMFATFPALEAVEAFAALLGSTTSSLRRIREIADGTSDTPGPSTADAWHPPESAPEIRFDGVAFAHPGRPGRRVLDRVDLTLPAGGFVGVVGPTGSGKSTLGALAARIWDPVVGRVLWDGHDLRHIPVDVLRDRVTVVDQDPYLLPTSIAANLRLGAPEATDERLWEALHAVDLDTFVRAMPDGLDTAISDRTLSGGQRQRLALARAILHDGAVIVVDEGTGQLDAATEARVVARLRREWAGRTVLWITHRESTLDRCDMVCRVRDGQVIVEESTASAC